MDISLYFYEVLFFGKCIMKKLHMSEVSRPLPKRLLGVTAG